MSLQVGVAEIERWQPEAVREVARAARRRGRAAFDAADGLAALPCFTSWGGRAADAARDAIARTRRDLDAHGSEAMVVAEAAGQAADRISALQADLMTLKVTAAASGLEVDAETVSIVARPGVGRRGEALAVMQDLQAGLDAIVAQANTVDLELAAALSSAEPTASDGDRGPAFGAAVPEDPALFRAMWNRLSRAERDAVFARDPNVGNHPGMPAGNATNVGQDHYNRRHLAAELARAEASQSPDLADLRAVAAVLRKTPDARLMLLDTTSGRRVHAAVAVGDPDVAEHVSVTTPGLNTTVAGSIQTMVGEAADLRDLAQAQLAQSERGDETVAAIAWIGYDAPQIPGVGDPLGSLEGTNDVSHDRVARAAAADLSRFYDGVIAAHRGPTHLTAVGHSYGSLTTGLALQQPGGHGVDDAVFYGSPGIQASTPFQLGLQPGHVFAMATPDDEIELVYDGPPVARLVGPLLPAPLGGLATSALAWAEVTDAGEFGPNPATNPNFVQMETGAATVFNGHGWPMALQEAHGHSDYPRQAQGPGGVEMTRTTGYNIAAVVAGLEERVILKK